MMLQLWMEDITEKVNKSMSDTIRINTTPNGRINMLR
jgi:hypothetical protein